MPVCQIHIRLANLNKGRVCVTPILGLHLTSRRPCWCTEQWWKKSFGNLVLLLCKTWATFCHCFVHQHGRLITWVQPKNRRLFKNETRTRPPICKLTPWTSNVYEIEANKGFWLFSKVNHLKNGVFMQKILRNLLIYVLFYECCAFFCELCDFSWIMRSDAIWGRLCEIAPSHNIRRPVPSSDLIIFYFQHFM